MSVSKESNDAYKIYEDLVRKFEAGDADVSECDVATAYSRYLSAHSHFDALQGYLPYSPYTLSQARRNHTLGSRPPHASYATQRWTRNTWNDIYHPDGTRRDDNGFQRFIDRVNGTAEDRKREHEHERDEAQWGQGRLSGRTGNPFVDNPFFNPWAPGGSFNKHGR